MACEVRFGARSPLFGLTVLFFALLWSRAFTVQADKADKAVKIVCRMRHKVRDSRNKVALDETQPAVEIVPERGNELAGIGLRDYGCQKGDGRNIAQLRGVQPDMEPCDAKQSRSAR
jgi:hypothetical protein